MTKYLAESGWTPTFRCWGSKRLDWGLDQVKRAKQLNQLPEYVIVALGTNDISWEQPATTERRVNTMLDRLGPDRQVLWVDLDIAYSTFSMTRADWFNKMIRQVAKDRPNLKVVPWEKIARQENTARFDGIHYGTSGYKLRARELTDALDKHARSLAQKSPSPSPEVS
jgi:lysophospholipase L1-like esterase